MEYYYKNKTYYDHFYKNVNPNQVAEKVRRRESFLRGGMPPSWEGLYWGTFREQLIDATILEIGAGDGCNSLMMAALGATKVVVVDITYHTKRIIDHVAARLRLSEKLEVRIGNFDRMNWDAVTFDFVVGKAILHHLSHEMEESYLRKATGLLKPTGEARFSESAPPTPGVKMIDEGPEKGLHPPRDDSATHYQNLFEKYYAKVQIIPIRRMNLIQAQVIVARQPRQP